jgi:hypothetical protein
MNAQVEQLLSIANAISRGEIPAYQHNECFTSGAFDLLLVHAQGAEAFSLLEQLGQHYDFAVSSGNSLTGYYQLLTQLARQTNTTEMPRGLQAIISAHPELSDELRAWYRSGT